MQNRASTDEKSISVDIAHNPYQPGKCWYSKSSRKLMPITCGHNAAEYIVSRWNSLLNCRTWLCDEHVQLARRNKDFLFTRTTTREDY